MVARLLDITVRLRVLVSSKTLSKIKNFKTSCLSVDILTILFVCKECAKEQNYKILDIIRFLRLLKDYLEAFE